MFVQKTTPLILPSVSFENEANFPSLRFSQTCLHHRSYCTTWPKTSIFKKALPYNDARYSNSGWWEVSVDHWEPQFLSLGTFFFRFRQEGNAACWIQKSRRTVSGQNNSYPSKMLETVHILFFHASQVEHSSLSPSLGPQPEICSLCTILTEVTEGKESQTQAQLVWCTTEGYQMRESCRMAFALRRWPMFSRSAHLYALSHTIILSISPSIFSPLVPYKAQHVQTEKEKAAKIYVLAWSIRILPKKGIFKE